MDRLSNWIDNLLNLGDPEVRTWFLVRQKSLPLIITAFYILFSTYIGPTLMRNRKQFQLRNILIIYNFSLVITYLSLLVCMSWYLRHLTFQELCYGTVVKKGDITYKAATVCWILYLVKYVEYLDTVFFILRKKQNQVTFLHVVHHSLIPFCVWVVLRTETGGVVAFPGYINSIVHVIMYSYYGLSAFGPEVRKYLWWKKHLTQLQMVQFFMIITYVLVIVPLTGCKVVITTYVIQITLAPLFLYLFYIYYRRSFQVKTTTTTAYQNENDEVFNYLVPEKETSNNSVRRNTVITEKSKKLH